MIDWIDCLGKTWGVHMRSEPICNSASLWTRNVDLIKSGITSDGTFWNGRPYKYPLHQIPIKSMSRDQLRFHRAWKRLRGGNRQELIWVHYVPHVNMKQKFNVMRLTEDSYFQAIDQTQECIEWEIVSGDL